MGDSLKDRLTQHSHAFESLLSLIPARYYYDEESNNQWKKKGARKTEEGKAEAKRNKKNKFDPAQGSSALDELKRRELLAADEEDSTVPKPQINDVDTNDVTIYDDNGNPINAEEELTVQELLKLKSIEKMKPGQYKLDPSNNEAKEEKLQAAVTPEPSSPLKSKKSKAQKASSKPQVPENPTDDSNDDADSFNTSPAAAATSTAASTEESTPEESTPKQEESGKKEDSEKQRPIQFPSGSSTNPNKSKPGIEALRAKLAAKVDEMKAKRKAPGSHATGAPKNREELLAARKLKLEQKKKLQKNSNEASESKNEKTPASDDEDDEDDDGEAKNSSPQIDMNLSFGQLQFKDGDRLGKDAASIEHQRKLKKRNAMDQLKVLENKKAKISQLDSEKQANIAENAKWSRAILQSEGAKVRDDEKLLKRTIKQNENRKKRSEKEWNRRIYQTKKGISDREAKRDANISAHREAKKMKLKGRKRKDHMKKASSNFNART